jgi:hypothetical protein
MAILREDFGGGQFSHSDLFQRRIQNGFRASLRGIDQRITKWGEEGEVSENSYFQESDFEINLFPAPNDRITQNELARIRFPFPCARI